MLSQTAQYALRTALQLARLPPGGRAAAGELAGQLHVPSNYLSKTLHQLARAGVVTGTRGKHGGFTLARAAHRIRLAEVIGPFQDVDQRSCLLGRPVCSDARPCAAHGRWKEVAEQLAEFFSRTTLADVLGLPGGDIGMKKASPLAHGRLSRPR